MTIIRVLFLGMCIVTPALGVASGNYSRLSAVTDQLFDSYGNISWEDEKAHLDNFAIELQHDENLIGYIIVYAGRRSCVGEAKNRALRAKEYLVGTRDIQGKRVRWIDGGYREELTVILQPVPHNAPELVPSPTIKPSNAVVRNCKPKSAKRKMNGS